MGGLNYSVYTICYFACTVKSLRGSHSISLSKPVLPPHAAQNHNKHRWIADTCSACSLKLCDVFYSAKYSSPCFLAAPFHQKKIFCMSFPRSIYIFLVTKSWMLAACCFEQLWLMQSFNCGWILNINGVHEVTVRQPPVQSKLTATDMI